MLFVGSPNREGNYGVLRDSFSAFVFRTITFACGRMRFVLYSPAQARLRSRGIQYKTKFLKGMIALPTPSTKVFGVAFFKKRRWFFKNSRRKG
jgi:hypothetical protein